MVPLAPVSRQRAAHEPFYDVNPLTGVSIEVFYADRELETFGRSGSGWFWWPRRRGFAPDGVATGPFPTSYSAYRNALEYGEPQVRGVRSGYPFMGTLEGELVGEKRENVSTK